MLEVFDSAVCGEQLAIENTVLLFGWSEFSTEECNRKSVFGAGNRLLQGCPNRYVAGI
jgi:hypothetical protein